MNELKRILMRKNNNLMLIQTRCLSTDLGHGMEIKAGTYKSIKYTTTFNFDSGKDERFTILFLLDEPMSFLDPLYKEFQPYCVDNLIYPDIFTSILKEFGFKDPFEHPDDASDLLKEFIQLRYGLKDDNHTTNLKDIENKAKELNLPSSIVFRISSGMTPIDSLSPECFETILTPQWVFDFQVSSRIGIAWDPEIFDTQKSVLLSRFKSELDKETTSAKVNILAITISTISC